MTMVIPDRRGRRVLRGLQARSVRKVSLANPALRDKTASMAKKELLALQVSLELPGRSARKGRRVLKVP